MLGLECELNFLSEPEIHLLGDVSEDEKQNTHRKKYAAVPLHVSQVPRRASMTDRKPHQQ
jgi:hypothetical protein